jgi:hypothetical protein
VPSVKTFAKRVEGARPNVSIDNPERRQRELE